MLLQVIGLNKSFKNKQVLKDVSFEVNYGEIVVLMGASGAGKTTTLRCINGLEECDRGSIIVEGQYLCQEVQGKTIYKKGKESRAIRRNIGLVFQSFNLFPHLNILENIIEAPITVDKLDKSKAIEGGRELLKLMNLEDKEEAYPCELSGGQKQRVAIARACALNPKIMCFDEPTSALDAELTKGVGEIIKNLAQEGMGILIITHDQNFAKEIAHRIIYMENGNIIRNTKENSN